MTNEELSFSVAPHEDEMARRVAKAAEDREIFHYHDGRRDRYGDPMLLFRRIHHNEKVDMSAIAPLVDECREPERTQYLDVVRQAFDVTEWNESTGEGLTEEETIDLVGQLAGYLESVKKNTAPGQTSLPPTDLESSASPEPPAPATSEPSASGETPNESKDESDGM